jgi:hypothetical protein
VVASSPERKDKEEKWKNFYNSNYNRRMNYRPQSAKVRSVRRFESVNKQKLKIKPEQTS